MRIQFSVSAHPLTFTYGSAITGDVKINGNFFHRGVIYFPEPRFRGWIAINDVKSFLNYRIRKVIYELSPTVRNRPERLRADYI